MEELPIKPSGILMQKEFITPEQEVTLIKIFNNDLTWPTSSGRRSLHYGYEFSYKTFGIDESSHTPFPPWLIPLIPTTESRPPEQVCLQHYPPGTGIPPHVDTHSAFDQLYSLSLGAPVFFQFGCKKTGERVDVDLEPRCMVQMTGESRLHWTHGIRARKTDVMGDGSVRWRGDRWSITYRWLREPAVCECGDEGLCDTAMRRKGVERVYRWKEENREEFKGTEAPQP